MIPQATAIAAAGVKLLAAGLSRVGVKTAAEVAGAAVVGMFKRSTKKEKSDGRKPK